MLVDFNEQAIKNLKDEIDGNNVSGEAHVTPRTSVTVRMTPDNRGDSLISMKLILPSMSLQDWNSLRSVFEWADQKFGRIDSVIACAGVTEDQHPSYDTDVLDSKVALFP